MNKIIGNEVEIESIKKIHVSQLEFLIKYRDLLDSIEILHQNITALNLLDESEEIQIKIKCANELISMASDFAPKLLKMGYLLDKIEYLSQSE